MIPAGKAFLRFATLLAGSWGALTSVTTLTSKLPNGREHLLKACLIAWASLAATLFDCSCQKQDRRELLPIVYKGLKLPLSESGQELSANYNSLTQKIDGNTDSNRDGTINHHDRDGRIQSEELFEEVFTHRERYLSIIRRLDRAGLEDPFQITPELKQHVQRILRGNNPKTQLEKAVFLFRSIIPPTNCFELGQRRYSGLSESEGGLEIRFYDSRKAPLRIRYGSPLPKEIVAAPREERVADCLEYSHLLTVLLRITGIKAHTKGAPEHAYVVALLEGEHYRLDPALLLFRRDKSSASSDKESIALHYSNEGVTFTEQNKLQKAIRYFNRALEMKPNYAEVLVNKGIALRRQGKLEEAMRYYNWALQINPVDVKAWSNKGIVLGRQGKLEEAMRCYDKALAIEPSYHKAWNNKGIAFYYQGRLREAIAHYDQAIECKPDYVKAWTNKGIALARQDRLEQAIKCFDKALSKEPDNAAVWYNRGAALRRQGQLADAEKSFEKFRRLRLAQT
jgi:tetratricopeptide (TPR) repeat protein